MAAKIQDLPSLLPRDVTVPLASWSGDVQDREAWNEQVTVHTELNGQYSSITPHQVRLAWPRSRRS